MPNKEHHSIRSVESVLCPQRQKLQQFRHPVAPKKTIDILTEEVPLKGHRGTQVPTTLMFGDMLTCQMFEKKHKRWLQGFVRSWMIKGLIESVCTLFCSHHLEVFPEHNAPQKCLRTWVSGSKTTRVYVQHLHPKKQSLPNSHQTQTSHRFKSQESIQPQHCKTWETRREQCIFTTRSEVCWPPLNRNMTIQKGFKSSEVVQ